MHRSRTLGLIAVIALAVGILLAACSQTPSRPTGGPSVGILSRGQISFSSLSFFALNSNDYTTLVPSASAMAKGLGSGDWTAVLSADWDLVYGCQNNGSNIPNGEFNFSLSSGLAYEALQSITKNGTAPVSLSSSKQVFDTTLTALEDGGQVPTAAQACPNPNYTLVALGARWNQIHISLYSGTYTSYDALPSTPADEVTYTCSDPANPSSTTCTIQ